MFAQIIDKGLNTDQKKRLAEIQATKKVQRLQKPSQEEVIGIICEDILQVIEEKIIQN